jgi:methionyl aminopeptidase
MVLKSAAEIEILRENAIIVSKTLGEVAKNIGPGVKTITLDRIAEEFIRSQGAVPGCISVNEEVVHGIPGERVLKNGDIVSIDCGCQKDGFYGDSAYTFEVGEVRKEMHLLLQRTRESLFRAVDVAVAGKRVGDISAAVQEFVESFGYSVVRELVGHGIGRQLHEKPDIPNFGRKGLGMKLLEGMTICIEPMINLGTKNVVQGKDGWTIRTADKMPSAHFELTVAVAKGNADVLSTFRYVEEVLGTKKI